MSYPVYLVESDGMPRNHHALFVRLNEDGSGELFHVTGNIQQGMTFERRAPELPHISATVAAMTQIGWVSTGDLARFAATCEANAPPTKQFEGPKRLNPKETLRRCQEWTAETIQCLKRDGILQAGQNQGTQLHQRVNTEGNKS